MTPLQQILGLIYLPLHILVFPLLFSLYAAVAPKEIPEITANVVYYLMGLAFVMIVMFSFLRSGYDVLVDRLRHCVLTLVLGLAVIYALDLAASALLMALDGVINNPANAEMNALAKKDFNTLKALAVFIGPIVEEVLFRGALFGTLRERSRGWAYVLSVVMFSLYHVWQFALAYQDWTMLLYAIQYIPVSIVLTWCYERTGCIWTSIFFHMGYNSVSFALIAAMM